MNIRHVSWFLGPFRLLRRSLRHRPTERPWCTGILAEMNRDATVARLAAGKAFWRGKKRLEGQYPYGEHPLRDFDNERAIGAPIEALHLSMSIYAIAKLF